jgi:hypothetical protein
MDSVLALVGLQPEPKPHNALNGAKLEAEAMRRIFAIQSPYGHEAKMCRELSQKQGGCNWGKCDSCGVIPLLHKLRTGEVVESAEDVRKLKGSVLGGA